MDRKPWKTWSVSNNTQMKWAHLQYSHTKRLIHKHRYDSAHPPGVECWIYGVMGCFYDYAPGFVSLRGSYPHRWSHCHPGLIRLCLPRFWGCYGDCDSVSYKMTSQHAWATRTSLCTVRLWRAKDTDMSVNAWSRNLYIMLVLLVGCLTFQILILLAHCPHADLFVDHIDTRKAATEI